MQTAPHAEASRQTVTTAQAATTEAGETTTEAGETTTREPTYEGDVRGGGRRGFGQQEE